MSKKAVIYARFSSDMQREESIDAQVRACKYFAQKQEIEIVNIYADRGKSGTSVKNRTAFLDMINESGKHTFDMVLVHKLNRFGRNTLDLLQYKQILEANRVELLSVTEKLDSTPEGKLMLMVLSGINEFYSATLAQEVMKGLKENAYQCKHTGGIPPLGYDVDPITKKLVLNEEEAKLVQYIFESYASGEGLGAIVNSLNKHGHKNKIGLPFSRNGVHVLLKNEKFMGVYTFDKSVSKDAFGKRRNEYKKEYIRIKDGCPQIISEQAFERVQIMMTKNRKSGGSNKAKATYILSGIATCGLCGHRLVGENRRSREVDYRYYVCNNAKRKKICPKKVVRKEELEKAVISKLNNISFSETFINNIANEMLKTYDSNENETTKNRLAKRLQELEKEKGNLMAAIKKGLDYDLASEELNKIQEEKESTLSALAVWENTPNEKMDIEQLKEYLKSFCNISNLSEESQKKIIQTYVSKVFVYDEPGGFRADIALNPNDEELQKNIHNIVNYVVDTVTGEGGI